MAGRIIRISGSLVVACGLEGSKMFDLVLVGNSKLMGEIIKIKDEFIFIQVYEETIGIRVGPPTIIMRSISLGDNFASLSACSIG